MTTITENLIDRDFLLQVFAAESEENLGAMEQSLIALESAPGDADLVNTIFRAAHTLKGNAATVALDPIVELAHLVEDLLEQVRVGRFSATEELITLLLHAVDALKTLVPAAVADPAAQAERQLLETLRTAIQTGAFVDARADEAAAPLSTAVSGDTLRVGVGKLDAMMNLAGEIAIARRRIRELTGMLADVPVELSDAQELLDRLCDDLQEQVMNVRMVPIEGAFQQQVRVARDLAHAAGKAVRIRFQGEDVELDTAVVEQMRTPLTHLVRNAVDHGIEPPERRVAAGKPRVGTITLSALHETGMVVVRVSDDGAGLDSLRIAERARELRLIESTAGLTDSDIHDLIFTPGFSTAGAVTEISGRGVGMDVVHHNVAALRGTVSIESSVGKGTAITMRLPLTLAIIDALSVGIGTATFVVPLDVVTECLDVAESQLRGRSTGLIDVRGEALPFVRLSACLGLPDGEQTRRCLLVVQEGQRRVGVVVDRLNHRMQAVIKPLRKPLPRMQGLAGATILGDGTVAIILDLPRLLRYQITEAA